MANDGSIATDLDQDSEPTNCLDGVRIVDLSQYEAGPSCTEVLAWLGAEVVKIEKPGTGEAARFGYQRKPGHDSYYFLQFNANKKSITLDLKKPKGIELLKQLIAEADIFIENLAPGAIERLGLSYSELQKINPKLIYAQIKGYGDGSKYESYLSYDPIAQAMGGIMSVTGEKGQAPVKPGPGLGDTGTGMLLANSLLGSLYRAQRTGKGQHLKIAMQDACMHYIRLAWAYNHATGEACGRHGGKSVTGHVVPMGVFPCKGGGSNDYVTLYCHAGVPEQFQRLLDVIGRPELKGDPRYIDQNARSTREPEVNAMIREWTMSLDKYEAMRLLSEAKVPAGAIRDTAELLADPDFVRRGVMQVVEHATLGPIQLMGWPVKHDGKHPTIKPAPLLGQHTQEVLTDWLGMDAAGQNRLKEDGVL
jgi:crotonobetainyl-CoA:carnitine CoA-transferase CaiB-like acyl-CoA transferase